MANGRRRLGHGKVAGGHELGRPLGRVADDPLGAHGGMMRPPVRLIASFTTAVSMPGTALAISAHTTSSPAIRAVGTPSAPPRIAKISPSPTVRPSRRTSAYSP